VYHAWHAVKKVRSRTHLGAIGRQAYLGGVVGVRGWGGRACTHGCHRPSGVYTKPVESVLAWDGIAELSRGLPKGIFLRLDVENSHEMCRAHTQATQAVPLCVSYHMLHVDVAVECNLIPSCDRHGCNNGVSKPLVADLLPVTGRRQRPADPFPSEDAGQRRVVRRTVAANASQVSVKYVYAWHPNGGPSCRGSSVKLAGECIPCGVQSVTEQARVCMLPMRVRPDLRGRT